MPPVELSELAQILQTAISPVALISGVGLLLLSMTNRLGRTIDRSRILARERKNADRAQSESASVQIKVLFQRSAILRLSITYAAVSILCASLIIISLFLIYIFKLDLLGLVTIFFILSVLFLVTSLVFFIRDITLALHALKMEIKENEENR